MDRYYSMSVSIDDPNSANIKAIEQAAIKEWLSFDYWYESSDDDKLVLSSNGDGYLCAGESDDEFATQLPRAIWAANGAFCNVRVGATYMENLPYEEYEIGVEAYQRFISEGS